MKRINLIIAFTTFTLAATAVRGATPPPGSILGVAGQVSGSISVTSSNLGGCPTRICTTNDVTFSRCYTNWVWKPVCVTNASGQVQCTNVPVPITHCFTNTFPEITCTNEFLGSTSLSVREQLSGALSATAGCDELIGMFPSNAMFEATLYLNVRTNDWVGTETGWFRIQAGTNLLAVGSLTGVTGLGSPVAGGPCGVCNHFVGTLQGAVLAAGPAPGARITAACAGDLTDVTCPSTDVPQGAVTLIINGVAVTPCQRQFGFDDGEAEGMPTATRN